MRKVKGVVLARGHVVIDQGTRRSSIKPPLSNTKTTGQRGK